MRSSGRDYLAYMLRLWRESGSTSEDGSDWRASLESAQTQERFVFATMADLFTFLQQEVEQACEPERRT